MKLAMLVTVGMGKNIWEGISYALRHRRPDYITFIATEGSKEKTLPQVLDSLNLSEEEYECRIVTDENDVEKCTLEFLEAIQSLHRKGFESDNLVADFTSGTKAMSAALVAAGLEGSVGELSYIAGERGDDGRVISGTERPVSLEPNRLTIRRLMAKAVELFNAPRFDTCLDLLGQIAQVSRLKDVNTAVKVFETLARGYRAWDRFDYKGATEILNKLTGNPLLSDWSLKSRLERHKVFLYQVQKNNYGVERATDLWHSAEKRQKEGRYDDAMARQYRLIEYIAQVRLFVNYNELETDNLDIDRLPETLRDKYNKRRNPAGKVSLGLYETYDLLRDLDDELGVLFISTFRGKGDLKKVLGMRNLSILAHGFNPVSKEGYEPAIGYVRSFLDCAFDGWERKAKDAQFPVLDLDQIIKALGLYS